LFYLCFEPENGGDMFLWASTEYRALYPRRQNYLGPDIGCRGCYISLIARLDEAAKRKPRAQQQSSSQASYLIDWTTRFFI
jgi:hypothetical protein